MCRGTPVCRETMLGVPRNNLIRKYEHYRSLTLTLITLPLAHMPDIFEHFNELNIKRQVKNKNILICSDKFQGLNRKQ